MKRKKKPEIVVTQLGRVGKDSRSQLNWLLGFVYLTVENLKQLSSTQRKQLRYDLAYFAA